MLEIIEWVGLLSLPAFIVLDLFFRARRYETPRGWRLRALAVSVFTFFFVTQVGELWGGFLPAFSLFDVSGLGTAGGAIVGILVYELGHYLYHRAAHKYDVLWLGAHQMHHSAESLDAFGANYLHPLDGIIFTSITVLVFFPLLGLSPEAAGVAASFLAFNAAFQHANIRTPHWLGYIIQRPESHVLHHGRGIHRYNYSDLPLWDMVFGTFKNPKTVDNEVGFYNGASGRIGEMLVARDVSRPRSKAKAAGAPTPDAAPQQDARAPSTRERIGAR